MQWENEMPVTNDQLFDAGNLTPQEVGAPGQWTPFKAYILLNIPMLNKRQEQIHALNKAGYFIQQGLSKDLALNLAKPGGAPFDDQLYGFGNPISVGHVAVKPQFGDSPPQATIVGFYDINLSAYPTKLNTTLPNNNHTVFHAGSVLTGDNGSQPWIDNPVQTVSDHVKSLKTNLISYISQTYPSSLGTFSVFRIEFNGIIFGDRGYHFPQ